MKSVSGKGVYNLLKEKPAYILIAVVLFAIVGITAFSQASACPESYTNDDERLAAMNQWTNDFYDSHPGASLGEWAKARHQFYVDHNCTIALERYEEAKSGEVE